MTDQSDCERWAEDDTVRLSFPVKSDFMVLARITGAAVAAKAGFAVDAVEDFRLAVEELCLLVQRHDGTTLHLAFRPSHQEVEVRCWLTPAGRSGAGDEDVDNDVVREFSRQILDSLADGWGEGSEGSESYMWFRMGSAEMVDET